VGFESDGLPGWVFLDWTPKTTPPSGRYGVGAEGSEVGDSNSLTSEEGGLDGGEDGTLDNLGLSEG